MSELYELPDGWKWKELKTFGTFIRGVSYKKPQLLDKTDDNSLTLLRANNIQTSLNLDEIQILPKEVAKGKIIEDGDILFAMSSGSEHLVGKNILLYGLKNYTFGAFCSVYRNNSNELNNYFLSYILKSNLYRKKLSKLSQGAGIKNLKSSDLELMHIPLPPLTEQQKIVSKLDLLFKKIDKSIALHQKNMDEADLFMGSVLNNVFGELEGKHDKRTLESFNKKMSSGGTPSRKEKLYWENGTIDWFSSGELNQLYTLPSKEKITQSGLDNTSTKLFSKGTLLIGMYDTAAMKMSILSTDGSCNQAIVGFKPNENELNIFFTKYQLEYLKKTILEQRQGVRQQNLNLSKIKNIEIEYPPLNIQKKVVKYLDEISEKIEKVKSVQKVKMDSLKALKASILDRAFRGEL